MSPPKISMWIPVPHLSQWEEYITVVTLQLILQYVNKQFETEAKLKTINRLETQ